VGTAAGSGADVDDGAAIAAVAAVVEVETAPLSASLVGEDAQADATRANAASTVAGPTRFMQHPLFAGTCNASSAMYVPMFQMLDSFGSCPSTPMRD
jgi:hypothetical protein